MVLGTKEFDARVGVAQRIWEETAGGKLVNKDRITGIKAGTMGYKDVDGILGIGLGSSTIAGLRETGVRCLKLSFRKENSGRDEMELLTDIDQEQNVVWYPVKAQDGEATWGVVLNKVTYGPRSLSAPRGTKVSLCVYLLTKDASGYRKCSHFASRCHCSNPFWTIRIVQNICASLFCNRLLVSE